MPAERTAEQIRADIEAEREHLAEAVEQLRGSLGVTEKVKAKLPVLAAGAAAAGFVLSGGIGATMRYFARRGRDRD